MTLPQVSLIIPCLNEETTISKLLDAVLHQTFEIEKCEVIIADAMSTDNTREQIVEFQRQHPEMHINLIDNPQRIIPVGVNFALDQSEGEFIVRLDAHTIPAKDYVEKCIRALQAGKGDNVGGVLDVKPARNTWIARSIACAAVHPLGVGDALYRHASVATEADTVAFGSFRRTLIDRIGKFDENLLANEDYEFNARIRASGGKIWVDPSIRAVYFSRPDLGALARQYFTYGFWKYKMLKRYPGTIRWRQALPPVFVFGLLMLLLLSLFWYPARIFMAVTILIYLAILVAGSIKPAINAGEPFKIIGIPLAIITMHLSWGAGFWWSLLKDISSR